MPNALVEATSPYLRQHAENPVDWLPWGEPAFERARAEDKPVLLSIGYSACHWCHVMARESFESAAIAAIVNRHFVAVKVDREERPDVDAIYMSAVQAMTGQGGWPLTVFLTPEGQPFYGGTYFPPAPRHGMAGFPQILEGIAGAWRDRRAEVLESAGRLTGALSRIARPASVDPDEATLAAILEAAPTALLSAIDPEHGGFGRAPKFPQATALSFLLDHALRRRDEQAARAVSESLDAMARGALWDHLGGGFHRYCVDAAWDLPHFEKMLYDNALLARLYLEAESLTRDAPRVSPDRASEASAAASVRGAGSPARGDALSEEALVALAWGPDRHPAMALAASGYALRQLRSDGLAFLASQDADTAAGEGAYFRWSPAALAEALPAADRPLARTWFGLRAGGGEGGGLPTTRRAPAEIATELGMSEPALHDRLASLYARLARSRAERESPATDGKLIAAWNGLMIDALARQAMRFDGPLGDELYQAAAAAADFLFEHLRVDGGLARSWKDGRAEVAAFLDDHAALGLACLSLYQARFEPTWYERALSLAESMIEQFGDPDAGGFWRSGPRNESLVLAQKPCEDSARPSGNALATELLLGLHGLSGEPRYAELLEASLNQALPLMRAAPMAAAGLLRVAAVWRSGPLQVAVIGPTDRGASALLSELCAYRPGLVRAWAPGPEAPAARRIALLRGRDLVEGRAAAYVCRGQICLRPVTEPAALRAILDGASDPFAPA